MKISVITVCFNSEATIAHTIRSFLDQTHADKEMIVVDGRSSDRTLDIVRSFQSPNIHIFSEPDQGIYDAMNKGLGLYRGDAVGFLNSDDTFHNAHVLDSIAAGLADADLVYGDVMFVSDHTQKRAVRIWKAGRYRRGCFRQGWLPPHPTFYIRRSLAAAVGLFDRRYGLSADYDYMLRAMEVETPRVRYVPKILVDFMHGGSTTNSVMRYVTGNLLCLQSRQKHLRAPVVDLALLLKPLRKIHQFRLSRRPRSSG
jgi:glycosyltransferase